MTDPSGTRTVIHVTCSRKFRDRLKAYAASQNKGMSELIISEMAEAMKFHDFEQTTSPSAARDDWVEMARATEEGRTIQ